MESCIATYNRFESYDVIFCPFFDRKNWQGDAEALGELRDNFVAAETWYSGGVCDTKELAQLKAKYHDIVFENANEDETNDETTD